LENAAKNEKCPKMSKNVQNVQNVQKNIWFFLFFDFCFFSFLLVGRGWWVNVHLGVCCWFMAVVSSQ
jgi:hypothetical protein